MYIIQEKLVNLQTKELIMEKYIHPLNLSNDLIQQRGLVVIENVTRLPVYGEPYLSPHFVVSLNHRGTVRAEYDMQQVVYNRHDIAMMLPNHPLLVHESSDDYLATLLVISSDFLQWLIQNVTHLTFFDLYNISSSHLTDLQFNSIAAYFKMLDSISRLDHPARSEMLATQIAVGTRMCDLFLFENHKTSPVRLTNKQKLLTNFYNAIVEHHRESREVGYYARLLCLSPKHFGTIVHQTTGVRASEWISRYVVLQAKTMLRHRTDMSIQQIASYLGFEDSSTFTRYFKASAGISPKEFRVSM